jgi:hypothetical protein
MRRADRDDNDLSGFLADRRQRTQRGPPGFTAVVKAFIDLLNGLAD